MVNTDALTGAYNRRCFLEKMAGEITKYQSEKNDKNDYGENRCQKYVLALPITLVKTLLKPLSSALIPPCIWLNRRGKIVLGMTKKHLKDLRCFLFTNSMGRLHRESIYLTGLPYKTYGHLRDYGHL